MFMFAENSKQTGMRARISSLGEENRCNRLYKGLLQKC
jgi:hypothetical protein